MKDYSPLFNQGLFSIASDAFLHIHRIPLQPPRSSRAVKGRSFLHLKASPYTDPESCKCAPSPLSASTSTSFSHSPTSPKPSSPTSPTRRLLPLPKPAPLSSLPAIPISVSTAPGPSRPTSPVPSSTLSSHKLPNLRRKHASLVPSFFSARTHITRDDSDAASTTRTVSTSYRKRRRQDALSALEGRRPAPSTPGASFVPSIEEEEPEDTYDSAQLGSSRDSYSCNGPMDHTHPRSHFRSHLSFGSTIHPVLPATSPSPTVIFSASTSASRQSVLRPPTTPCFSVAYAAEPTAYSRRASTGTAKIGWGINFIDLEDDSTSSLWRWSHVA